MMRKTVKVRTTIKPISSRSVRVHTSVSANGTTRSRSKTIRLK